MVDLCLAIEREARQQLLVRAPGLVAELEAEFRRIRPVLARATEDVPGWSES